jgi:sugar lactone lactonase YvrE
MPELKTLLTGLAMGESPRWHAGRLWLSDWGAQEVVATDLAGTREVIAQVPSVPFCIDWLPDGRLLIVAGGQVRLLRMEPDGAPVTHAELTSISDKPWNEIVVDGRGNVYLNNIGFNFPGGEFAPGVIALVTPDGAVRQVVDGLAFPNGMAVTPDNATLVVAESYSNCLTAFDIAPDGSLTNRRVWADLGGDYPDGICIDADNAIWYADVPHQHCVRVREGGEILQTIKLDRGCFACALGGANKRTLFIVANDWGGPESMAGGARQGQVIMADAHAPGAGWP